VFLPPRRTESRAPTSSHSDHLHLALLRNASSNVPTETFPCTLATHQQHRRRFPTTPSNEEQATDATQRHGDNDNDNNNDSDSDNEATTLAAAALQRCGDGWRGHSLWHALSERFCTLMCVQIQ